MWYFWAIGRHSTIFKNARQENARKESIQIFGWPYIEVIHAIQIKFKLYIIQSYSWVWAGWSKMKIPRNCALFPFLPLIHDTLGFSFKFYKILNKPRCSPQCISSWKLLLLCHSVIKICDMIPMSILAKGLASTVGDRVMTCYNFDFGVSRLMFLSSDMIPLWSHFPSFFWRDISDTGIIYFCLSLLILKL